MIHFRIYFVNRFDTKTANNQNSGISGGTVMPRGRRKSGAAGAENSEMKKALLTRQIDAAKEEIKAQKAKIITLRRRLSKLEKQESENAMRELADAVTKSGKSVSEWLEALAEKGKNAL